MNGYIGNKKWFVTLLKILAVIVLAMLILSIVKTCSDCVPAKKDEKRVQVIIRNAGYLPDNENWDNIPDIVPPYDIDSLDRLDSLDSLPKRVILEQFFPPIGDQGNKGTCVVWATGYNLKTALNAIDNKWTKEQLEDPAYQTSPRDLWYGIQGHDPNCGGASFEYTCTALQRSGAATMKLMPYGNMPCRGTNKGDAGNTILSYGVLGREGTRMPSEKVVKAYIRDTIPLVFGARLGSRFMDWSSDKVFKSDVYDYTGMHQYHAMVLVGYDDSLHAFRIRNSWGTQWGDKGSAWVDYDFFLKGFCTDIFVLKNGQSHPSSITQR